MAGPGTGLERLSFSDRVIIDGVAEGLRDAEIAVRLGIAVGELKERVDRLVRQFGLTERAQLPSILHGRPVSSASPGGKDPPPRHGVPGATPGGEEAAARRHTRRVVLGAMAGGVAVVGGGIAAAAIIRAGMDGGAADDLSGETATPAPGAATTTPTAPSTVTPSPTPVIERRIEASRAAFEMWERAVFPDGALIDWTHGIFFMDIDTGAIEAWRLRIGGGESTPAWGYTPWLGGQYVTAAGVGTGRGYAVDRVRQLGWSWPGDLLGPVAAADVPSHGPVLVFEERMSPSPSAEGGIYRFYDGYLAGYRVLSLPRIDWAPPPFFSPDGKHFIAWTRPGVLPGKMVRVDTATLTVTAEFPVAAANHSFQARVNGLEAGADWFELATEGLSGEIVRHYRFPYAGDWASVASRPGPPMTSWAPGGTAGLREVTPRYAPAPGADEFDERWSQVEVLAGAGEPPQVVLRSAAIHYGDFGADHRWTADGKAFTALVDDGSAGGPGWDRSGYALVEPGAGKITRFVLSPSGPEWFQGTLYRGPIPSPYDSNLFSFGKLELFNRATGRWFRARMAERDGPTHIDPWSAGRREMVFGWPHGGHGGRGPAALIQASFAKSTPVTPFRFVVSGAGDCLNLRETASREAKVLDCLPDGTPLTLVEPPAGSRPGTFSFVRNETGAWVHVRTGAGREGWVANNYLAWAD